MSYTSKDFYKTQETIIKKTNLKLKHENVLATSSNTQFTKEREHNVGIVDLPSHSICMTIGGLLPHQKTRKHRHNYETIIYIIKGTGKSIIDGEDIFWKQGDAIYIPVWHWHEHVNLSDVECEYVACENATMLQNAGNIAVREESQE